MIDMIRINKDYFNDNDNFIDWDFSIIKGVEDMLKLRETIMNDDMEYIIYRHREDNNED